MRSSRMMLVALLLGGAMTMTGCENRLKSDNVSLQEEVTSLRSQLAERNKALEDCDADLRSRDQQLACPASPFISPALEHQALSFVIDQRQSAPRENPKHAGRHFILRPV